MITLDGIPIKDLGFFVLQDGDIHPSPNFVNKTVKIPGMAGEHHLGTEINPRPHTIPLGVLEDSQLESQNKFRKFFEVALDEYGKPKPMKMIYDYEPDKYYTVWLDGEFSPIRSFALINGPVNLVSYDPFAYSIVSADELTWGNEVITFESYYLLGHEGTAGMIEVTENTSFNLSVDGYAVKPIIEINGSADDLTVSVGNQSFSLPKFNGEWKIDSSMFTALYNGQNAFNDYQGDFITLSQGTNEMKINGSNMDLSIRVKYEDRYV